MTSKAFQHRPTFPLASQDLERWIRFSAKGGVGRARAIADRVSQDGHKDLMMLEGDEVIVLMDLGDDQYLGHCEGVVGLFRSEDVEFLQAKLKRPVMTPRSSRPSTSHNNLAAASQIRTNPVGLPESQNVDLNAKVTTRRMGDIQGLGIDSIEGQRTESGSAPQVAQSVDAVIVTSPQLAGAFTPAGLYPRPPSSLDSRSPCFVSDAHTPSLVESPHSVETFQTQSMPPTPLVPVGWETPDATGADLQQTQNDRDHVLPTEPVPHSYDPKLCAVPRQTEAASLDFPASASATTRGLLVVGAGLSVPFPSSSSLADLQPPPPRRQPKTSESTFVSTYSGDSIESPSNSGPGTPGEDNTLAFIFDSYRYSRSSSAASFGGPSFRTDLPGMRPALALDELQLVEEVIDAQGTETAEMSDAWTNRVRRRDAASALPARLSPNRSRSSSRSEAEVVSRSSAARAKERHILDNHPEVEQSGLPPAAGSQDYCSDHAALLLEQKAASAWSSGGANDLSPQNSDVFADSPTSSLAARSSALARDVQSPSSQTSLNLGQSRTGVYYPAEGPAGSPAAASFQTAASTDRFQDSSAAEDSDRSQTHNVATTPVRNKLRKKPSFRLRKSSATESDLDISNVAPPLPRLADQIGNDHLDTASPPRSPARQLLRKNSIGSKFSRKSSEAAQKKRIDYGTGISNKDFEEETIQIGASAFEIVKPYAALVVRDQEPLDDLASLDSPDSSALSHNDHYVDPYHLSNPATPSHLGNSFSNAQSHFSPPTPQSVEGDHRSVQDHRARELKWVQTLSSGLSAAQLRKSKKMRTLVYGGIPSSVRGKVWSFLAESDREREPELFARLSSKGPSRHSAAYEQDLDTLLLDHPQFARASAGREDLVTVLNAFSHLDPQLGYYPRLADVVALLLTQMPAEESFFTLVSLVRNYGFRQFFVVGREELRLEVVAFSFLLEAVEPKISRRFRDLEIETSDYLVSWLSTCFLSILQLPTVLRIIDVFLLEPKTRYSAPLAILRLSQFTSVDLFPSRDSVLNHLLAPPPDIFTPQRLVPAIVGYKLSDDKVQKAIKMAAKEMLAPKKQR